MGVAQALGCALRWVIEVATDALRILCQTGGWLKSPSNTCWYCKCSPSCSPGAPWRCSSGYTYVTQCLLQRVWDVTWLGTRLPRGGRSHRSVGSGSPLWCC